MSRRLSRFFALFFALFVGCASIPEVRHDWNSFPDHAYFGVPKRPFIALGQVRSRVDYPTLDAENDEKKLCVNYFNKAVKKLLAIAKRKGADAVVDVRSVAVYLDGKTETFSRAECVDEGAEGQVLTQGVAVKWKPRQKKRTQSKSL